MHFGLMYPRGAALGLIGSSNSDSSGDRIDRKPQVTLAIC